MRTRTTWIVVGGAAAVVLAPIAVVYGSAPLDDSLQRTGVVLDAEAANRARAERTAAERARVPPSAEPSASSTPKAAKKSTAKATVEPTGKKTVSAASPVSSHTPVSPVSPNTPG